MYGMENASIVCEAEGLLEAPLVHADGSVLFVDTTGGGVHHWTSTGTETVLGRRRGIGGLASHADGGLLVSGRDLTYADHGETSTILAPDGATGINDIAVAADGSLFAGVLRHRPALGETAPPSELLQIATDGSVRIVADDLLWPNGIGFSPDGASTYVSEYAASQVRILGGDGSEVFAEAPRGECDGLAVDVEGGVWVALGSGGGIARFTQAGELDEIIELPGRFVSSLAFAGTSIYVTTAGALLRLHVGVAGVPVSDATIPTGRTLG